jgi:hypothetical protein
MIDEEEVCKIQRVLRVLLNENCVSQKLGLLVTNIFDGFESPA